MFWFYNPIQLHLCSFVFLPDSVMQGAHDAFLRACRFHHLDLAFKAYDCLHSISGTFFYYICHRLKKSSLFLMYRGDLRSSEILISYFISFIQ